MKKLVAMALLAWMLLAGCTAEDGPAEGSLVESTDEREVTVSSEETAPGGEADRLFAEEAYAALEAGELSAFAAEQPDLVRLSQPVWPGYDLLGPDTAVLVTHKAFPDSLAANTVWKNSERLEEFFSNCAAGTPDSLWYGDTGEPLPLLVYKLEFDGESLSRHYYPDPSLPDGVAAEETVPLTLELTDTGARLREPDGTVWLVWARYGFARYVPTEEEIAAAAGGTLTREVVENTGRGEAVCLTGEGFTLYLAADGSAAYGIEQVNGADLLLLRPRPAPDPLTERDREVGIAALSLNTQVINGDPAWEEFYRAQEDFVFLQYSDSAPAKRGEKDRAVFGAELFRLTCPDGVPKALAPEDLFSNLPRLEEFLDHHRHGEADTIWYCISGAPLGLMVYRVETDGTELRCWFLNREDAGYPDTLSLEEDELAVRLVTANGGILLEVPTYGYERFVPTMEQITAIAGDAELRSHSSEIGGCPCTEWEVCPEENIVFDSIAISDDGTAAFWPDRVNGSTVLIMRLAERPL